MFKKPFAVQNQNLLSKKDLKAVKALIAEQFPGLDEKGADQLLPEGQAKCLKLADSRCLLYCSGDAAPCFFDAEGRGELVPCLTTLWRYKDMLPELTIYSEVVSKALLNGADLMLPGIIVPANGVVGFGSVTKGQVRCIRVEGNPYAIAVGRMLVNQAQFEKLKGKGIEVAHVYKDVLWGYSGKLVPNGGFSEKEDQIMACSEMTLKFAADGSVVASDAGAAASAGDGKPTARTPAAAGDAAALAESSAGVGTGDAGGSRRPDDWSQDDLLDFCFMQAFKVSLTDAKALPVEASDLYEKHMKPQRPEGTTLDVKKSSHKQIGKYLNAMRKAKAIDVTEKKNVVHVTKVDLGNKVFKELEAKFEACAGAAASGPSAGSSTAAAGLPEPKITTAWKPTHYTEALFKAMGKGKNDMLNTDEARQMLKAYCEKESLLLADDKVKLSEDLLTILYKAAGAQKKDATWPEEAAWDEAEEKLFERLQEHTSVDVAGVGITTRKGPAVKIEVSLSRKGAHNVTRIVNLECYGLDVEKLGDELKKKLNCTVYIEDMPGKNSKDKMLQLQGHADRELAEYLLARYGVPKSMLSVK